MYNFIEANQPLVGFIKSTFGKIYQINRWSTVTDLFFVICAFKW